MTNTTTIAPVLTVETVRARLATDDRWLTRAIVAIYEQQTADEQENQTTSHLNGVGFSGVDAAFCSSLAQQITRGRTLSAKQIAIARKIMRKYAAQLVRLAEAKAAQPARCRGCNSTEEESGCRVERDGLCCDCRADIAWDQIESERDDKD